MVAMDSKMCDIDGSRGLLLPDHKIVVLNSHGKMNRGTKVRLVYDPVVATLFISRLAWCTGACQGFFDRCSMRIPNAKIDSIISTRWSCDKETGQLFRDSIPYHPKPFRLKKRLYTNVSVGGIKVRSHRVVWRLCTGAWPVGDIDHINGNSLDNRLCNLRDVTNSDNCKNKMRFKSRDLPPGVYKKKLKSGGVIYYAEVGVGSRTKKGQHRAELKDAISDRVELLKQHGYSELHIASSTLEEQDK